MHPISRSAVLCTVAVVTLGAGCATNGADDHEAIGIQRSEVTSGDLVTLALANVADGSGLGTACGTNSLGGSGYETSCTGNGGQPEYWCADFVMWVWANNGIDVSGLSAAAGSFYVYGQNRGTLSNSPAVGDAVVFDYQGGGYADHVALVTKVNDDGTIETVSGDWNGLNGSEAYFSSTSQVVLNTPAYDATVGDTPGVMGMTISGYIAPAGVASGGTDACAGLDDGCYCGGDDVPGDPDTLYQCAGGALVGSQPCPNTCVVEPGDLNDECQ
jgi:surface antigen